MVTWHPEFVPVKLKSCGNYVHILVYIKIILVLPKACNYTFHVTLKISSDIIHRLVLHRRQSVFTVR